ncbi:polysaccharide deacetylase family protein [Candidatus Latescibacterota bacterium]
MASFLPILTFHDISKRTSVISIPPGVFQCNIAKLYESGYKSLNLMEAVNFLRRGVQFPDNAFVITFDDGYQSVYEEAFPVLKCYNMSATVFLAVGEKEAVKSRVQLPSLDERTMMSWDEIREMQQMGITFGAHTCTHQNLTHLPFERVKAEVCDSKAIIEDALGTTVVCFAYPYGHYNHQVHKIVQQNFDCACSDKLGFITKHSDPYALKRVDAYYLRTDRLFNIMLSRLFPLYIRARSIPRRIRRAFQFR